MVLHCLQGTVWLTRGDGVDYLLYRGESFRLEAGACALAEALGAAEIRLASAGCQPAGSRPVLALEARRACP